MRCREARHQPPNCNSNCDAAEHVADAGMRAEAEGQDATPITTDVEAQWIGKDRRIEVSRLRRGAHDHPLGDLRSAELGVASSDARKSEVPARSKTQTFFYRDRDEVRLAHQDTHLVGVRVKRIENASHGPAGG